ncbi:OLC1v1003089C1 [Oldenlandia corymbosa var. corymbosa]|uniref:OLC1v1003089C1 n=1 Tax=Oldenlandia corymbosa var. corymbosa TaxID=529605 RepID=A0AAV1DB37_OLDCO|nr:OLC1v1003089C1 [Oldenlandia corymbosa var. corymbosa]
MDDLILPSVAMEDSNALFERRERWMYEPIPASGGGGVEISPPTSILLHYSILSSASFFRSSKVTIAEKFGTAKKAAAASTAAAATWKVVLDKKSDLRCEISSSYQDKIKKGIYESPSLLKKLVSNRGYRPARCIPIQPPHQRCWVLWGSATFCHGPCNIYEEWCGSLILLAGAGFIAVGGSELIVVSQFGCCWSSKSSSHFCLTGPEQDSMDVDDGYAGVEEDDYFEGSRPNWNNFLPPAYPQGNYPSCSAVCMSTAVAASRSYQGVEPVVELSAWDLFKLSGCQTTSWDHLSLLMGAYGLMPEQFCPYPGRQVNSPCSYQSTRGYRLRELLPLPDHISYDERPDCEEIFLHDYEIVQDKEMMKDLLHKHPGVTVLKSDQNFKDWKGKGKEDVRRTIIEPAVQQSCTSVVDQLDPQEMFLQVFRNVAENVGNRLKKQPVIVEHIEKTFDGIGIRRLLSNKSDLDKSLEHALKSVSKDHHGKMLKDHLRVALDALAPLSGLPLVGDVNEMDQIINDELRMLNAADVELVKEEEFKKLLTAGLTSIMLRLEGNPISVSTYSVLPERQSLIASSSTVPEAPGS